LAKQLAANRIKGVVGNRGNTTPMTPKPMLIQPIIINIKFLVVRLIDISCSS
jgi:hypothetical protein